MNKSLTPLIISFAVIILLTFIVINSKPGRESIPGGDGDGATSMTLNSLPETGLKHKKSASAAGSAKTFVPNSVKTLEEAKVFLSNGKENEAEDAIKTLLVFEPDNFSALSLLGGIFYYSQRYSEAEMIFRRQLKLSPSNEVIYNSLGSALAKQNKMEEAIKSVSKAVELNPKLADAQINLSSMYCVSGDIQSCIRHFLLAYQLIGRRILPFSYDPAFDGARAFPEFQEIIARAKKDWQDNLKNGKRQEENSAGEKSGGLQNRNPDLNPL